MKFTHAKSPLRMRNVIFNLLLYRDAEVVSFSVLLRVGKVYLYNKVFFMKRLRVERIYSGS